MASTKGIHRDEPPLWITVSLAGTAALVLSYQWLTRGPETWFDFRLLLLPIYAPLAFGILWPVALYVQAGVLHVDRSVRPWRYRVALGFVLLSCVACIPFVRLEMQEAKDVREQARLEAQRRQQMLADQRAAQKALDTSGILAFTEPLQDQQALVLERFIYENHFEADQLLDASEHYRNPLTLKDIAAKETCPGEALEVIYSKLTAEATSLARSDYSAREDALSAIAQNPHVSSKLLARMIESDDAIQRIGAFRNNKLPAASRLAYLKKGCAVEGPEAVLIVGAPETPIEVMECLARKSSAAYAVIYGPRTPEHILEELTLSPDLGISKAANEQLLRRRAEHQK